MRNRSGGECLRSMLEMPRYEVLPTPAVIDQVGQHVPVGRTFTVTASVSLGLSATLSVTEELQRHGYHAVPHLAARMITDRVELAEIVDRLQSAGVDSVFVPAGDATPEAGSYASALDLLCDLSALGAPFRHIGIAGYPESHPSITDDVTIQSMWDKRLLATHIVSNLCLDPAVLTAWVQRIRARGLQLPLLIGVPGQVDTAKLLTMATRIGLGESSRFLAKNKSIMARMVFGSGYRPERFLARLAPTVAHPASGIAGLHVYTFNQVAATEAWRRRCLDRLPIGVRATAG